MPVPHDAIVVNESPTSASVHAFWIYIIKSAWWTISRYGYAAFGLTVIPYLVGSLLNSIADVLAPS